MKLRRLSNMRIAGFTLIESVIALGVFGIALVIIMGVFSQNIAKGRAVEERVAAQGLIEPVTAVLKQIGWDSLIEQNQLQNGTIILVADADGAVLELQGQGDLSGSDQYYLIIPELYDQPGHVYGSDLRGVALVSVWISWPYRVPTSGGGFLEIDIDDRRHYEFVTSIRP